MSNAMDNVNMNGNRFEDINFSVSVSWGYDNGKPYCEGILSKLAPDEKEIAYEHDGFNFVGGCGREGAEFYCYATAEEAVTKAAYNPFALEYYGDFTTEEINKMHSAIRSLYAEGKLEQFKATEEQVKNFALDFNEKYLKNKKEVSDCEA